MVPEKQTSLTSVVFDYAGMTFLGVGFVTVDRAARTFRVVCLNPMGVKILDLSGDDAGVETNFVLEPLARAGDLGAAVAADIRRIYLDLVPAPDAVPCRGETRVDFRQNVPGGVLEHRFAGPAGDLVRKRFFADQALSWEASYFDYAGQDGARVPRGIVLTNYRAGYELVVREKELASEQDESGPGRSDDPR
jgi:hypothetical protein